jgi:hypothetical protein
MGPSASASINEVATKKNLQRNVLPPQKQGLIPSRPKIHSHALKEAIKREAGGNDIMAAILADTAEKTLPTMLQNEGRAPIMPPGGAAEKLVASLEPEDLFGAETASKWADLAFTNTPRK